MNKQQEALRMAGKFLWLQAMGHTVSKDDCKRLADLCFIVLPMKYRLDKHEIETMKASLQLDTYGPTHRQ